MGPATRSAAVRPPGRQAPSWTGEDEADGSRASRLPPWLLQTLLIYLGSRLLVAGAALGVAAVRPWRSMHIWDGVYYLSIAGHGYPTDLATRMRGTPASSLGFFPGYPLLIRATGLLLGSHWGWAAYLVNVVLGAVVVCMLRELVIRVVSVDAGAKAVWLYCLFPGTVCFSLPSSEPLAISAALGAMLAVSSRRWVTAGLAAAAATMTRPNMLALVVALCVAALLAVVRERDWRALTAPALAPFGILGFFAYLWVHTGDLQAWQHAERRYWHQNLDWGVGLPHYLVRYLQPPWGPEFPNAFFLVIGGLVALAGVIGLAQQRHVVPVPLLVFTAGVLVLCLAYSNFGPRVRFVATAFPLFMGLAARLPRRSFQVWCAISSVLLVTETVLVLAAPHSYP